MICVKIQGKEYPIAFTLAAMDDIEDRTGKAVGELSLSMKRKQDRAELLEALAVMMRAGAADGAETPDAEALHAMMRPGEMLAAITRMSDEISAGLAMETEEPDEDEEVDVVLEDIKKKEPPAE